MNNSAMTGEALRDLHPENVGDVESEYQQKA
jgi:hypothetical protein